MRIVIVFVLLASPAIVRLAAVEDEIGFPLLPDSKIWVLTVTFEGEVELLSSDALRITVAADLVTTRVDT